LLGNDTRKPTLRKSGRRRKGAQGNACGRLHSVSPRSDIPDISGRRIPFLQPILNEHKLRSRVDKAMSNLNADGAPAPLCQLSEVQAGTSVLIKQLSASPEVTKRLRELGFCEEQRLKLLSRNPNLICQVCNARLGLSSQLADLIWVEKIKPQRLAA